MSNATRLRRAGASASGARFVSPLINPRMAQRSAAAARNDGNFVTRFSACRNRHSRNRGAPRPGRGRRARARRTPRNSAAGRCSAARVGPGWRLVSLRRCNCRSGIESEAGQRHPTHRREVRQEVEVSVGPVEADRQAEPRVLAEERCHGSKFVFRERAVDRHAPAQAVRAGERLGSKRRAKLSNGEAKAAISRVLLHRRRKDRRFRGELKREDAT